jgi:hypothetical protein
MAEAKCVPKDRARTVGRRASERTGRCPKAADRATARKLATYHRCQLTGAIRTPTDLLNFVVWIGCAALAGDVSLQEGRLIAALLLPFAKVTGSVEIPLPKNIESRLKGEDA